MEEIDEVFLDLEDEEIDAPITKDEIRVILERFYQYYDEECLISYFVDDMISHFNDMCWDAVYYDHPFDVFFVLGELRLYELLDSPMELDPRKTDKVLQKIKNEICRR